MAANVEAINVAATAPTANRMNNASVAENKIFLKSNRPD